MSRWVTVANRLPFSLSKDGRKITTSSGGLVSALNGVKAKAERLWVGCAPDGLTRESWPELEKTLKSNSSSTQTSNSWEYQPVFPGKELYDAYYNGLCNDVLWPLLHYQPELVAFDLGTWNAYREMNEMFAGEIARIAKDDDLIWIHDFHLFLLPKMLKKLRPSLKVGFFLHVPFPSSEVFRQLPVREEILDSLLSSDLIGFHDYSYLRHFSSSVLRLLGHEADLLSVRRGNHIAKLGVFPVSIDTEQFVRRGRDPKVRALELEFKKPQFTFLGVDRLDYMKGLDLKLKAYRTLLSRHPQYREQVCLLQVAVPTRQDVPVYMELARDTARLVGEINGEFATPNWTPIHYIHASVTSDQLIALYRAADALLVTSKRDGMNLVALEYLMAQGDDNPGVILLSEFAGAISTLSHTLPINPWDLEDAADKMQLAMEMPKAERLNRLKTMQQFLNDYNASDWAAAFITELQRTPAETEEVGPRKLSVEKTDPCLNVIRSRIVDSEAKKLTIFLDYDGTLVPIKPSPEMAVLSEDGRDLVRKIASIPWIELVIVSGRDSRFLQTQFEGIPVAMAAEHGAKFFDPAVGKWRTRVHRSRTGWYPSAAKIISDYAIRVPHSQIEKKHFAIAWHYRRSPQDYGDFQARKLAEELEAGLANQPVNILRGKKVIEVRAIEADKGVFARWYLDQGESDRFAIAIGDDRTDEDLFEAIRANHGVSIKVGLGPSHAEFALPQQHEILDLLTRLSELVELPISPELSANLKKARHTRLSDETAAKGTIH